MTTSPTRWIRRVGQRTHAHVGKFACDTAPTALTAHVRRYHQHYHSSEHIWQGRFQSFPIEEDDHLLTVLLYIERNPGRANLVERAQDYRE